MDIAAIVVAVVSLIVSLVISVWGFRRTSRSEHLRMFLDLHDRYLSPEVRTGRRLIHQRLAGAAGAPGAGGVPGDDLTCEERQTIHFALAIMNVLAIACEGGHVEYRLVKRTMGRSFASAIDQARPHVAAESQRRGYPVYPFALRLAARIRADLG